MLQEKEQSGQGQERGGNKKKHSQDDGSQMIGAIRALPTVQVGNIEETHAVYLGTYVANKDVEKLGTQSQTGTASSAGVYMVASMETGIIIYAESGCNRSRQLHVHATAFSVRVRPGHLESARWILADV